MSPVSTPKPVGKVADPHAIRLRLLPTYVAPEASESLLSWVLRLASSLGVPVNILTRTTLGINARVTDSIWWAYPTPWLVARIAAKTDMNPARIRAMTFADWAPRYRDDDARERFSGVRLQTFTAAKRRDIRLAVCVQCLSETKTAYLPLPWTLGWVSNCPKHGTVMATRCAHCTYKLRLPSFTTRCAFDPQRCVHCNAGISAPSIGAHPLAIDMQEKLLRGKRTGATDLNGIGHLTWQQTVTFLDLLICLFWTGTLYEERWRYVAEFFDDFPARVDVEMSPYHSRYGGLCFLAWLMHDWPQGRGAKVARMLLVRWLEGRQPQASRFAGIPARSDTSVIGSLWDTPEDKFRSILVAAVGGDAHSLFSRSRLSIL